MITKFLVKSYVLWIAILVVVFISACGSAEVNSPTTSNTVFPSVVVSTNAVLRENISGQITFTFNEDVRNFIKDDITVTGKDSNNQEFSVVKGDLLEKEQDSYVLNVTPNGIGILTVEIPAGSLEDFAGNFNEAVSTNIAVLESTPPTVKIQTNQSALEWNTQSIITFVFSEDVRHFSKDDVFFYDVEVEKGEFRANSKKEYELDITPKGDGTLRTEIPAGSLEDLAGNPNEMVSTNFSVLADTTPPTVVVSTNAVLRENISGQITFSFSEDVRNFIKDDITVTGKDSNNQEFSVVKGDLLEKEQDSYVLNVTPNGIGTLTVEIPVDSLEDFAGNSNESVSTSFSVLESTPPTVKIQTNQSALDRNTQNIITFVFSEDVRHFSKDDVFFYDVEVEKGEFRTNSKKEYELDITPRGDGTLRTEIPAGSLEDLAGNSNEIVSTNFLVSKDSIIPTVEIKLPNPISFLVEDDLSLFFITFSEDVTEFTPDDIVFSPSDISVNRVDFTTNSFKEYTLSVRLQGSGDLTLEIPADSLEDFAGNKNLVYSTNFKLHPEAGVNTISFKLNGGAFKTSQVTKLKVVDGETVDEDKLNQILSYPATGPQPNYLPITRGIFQWRSDGAKYDFSTLVTNDLTLESVWSNSCGMVETFHPANKGELQNYIDKAIAANPTTNLNHIDTSSITDMSNLFSTKGNNGEIACWNVSSVNNMRRMFYGITAFNKSISNWDVSSVNNMEEMFGFAYTFNQPIGNWDVSSVKNMKLMFFNARVFNQPIGDWDVSSVNNMREIFLNAFAFNQPIGDWDVSSVNNMQGMFGDARSFNQPIGDWDVSNVTDMQSMFSGAFAFNRPIGNWDVSNVNNMQGMFRGANTFNQPIGNWDVSSVTDMKEMFRAAFAFDQDLRNWSVDNVNNYISVFSGSAMKGKFDKYPLRFLPSFKVNLVPNGGVFLNPEVTSLETRYNNTIDEEGLSQLLSYPATGPQPDYLPITRKLFEWQTSGGAKYSFSSPIINNIDLYAIWQNNCGSVETFHPANKEELQNYIDKAIVASPKTNLNHIDTSAITDMSELLKDQTTFNGELTCWNVSNVTNMNGMFSGSTSFNQPIVNWNLHNVTTMNSMFSGATSFNQDLSGWPVSQVTAYDDVFKDSAMEGVDSKYPPKFLPASTDP